MNEYEQRIFALSRDNEVLEEEIVILQRTIKSLLTLKRDEIARLYKEQFRLWDMIEQSNDYYPDSKDIHLVGTRLLEGWKK